MRADARLERVVIGGGVVVVEILQVDEGNFDL